MRCAPARRVLRVFEIIIAAMIAAIKASVMAFASLHSTLVLAKAETRLFAKRSGFPLARDRAEVE